MNVAAERINPGELLAGKAIKEVREITALRNPPIADLSDLTAKKAIQKGKIITEDLSLPKPDRVKGEPIQLIYKDGDLIIEISAVAAGDAVQGKIFPVLNPINSKIVNARYLGNGRAQIYY
ncbi:MAG: flagella basal body P-ring formation protein FlgA [Deferribacteraceae bacterium]|nr:flagella basal body P-ring formation protein FlgA [Deferribacteraceae bacterium]